MLETPAFASIMKGNRAGLWATLLGAVLIFVCWQAPLILLALYLPDAIAFLGLRAGFETANEEALTMLTFLLMGFGPGFCVLLAWRKFMEKRAISTLFTAHAHFRWRYMAVACGFMILFGLGLTFGLDKQGSADIMVRVRKFELGDWVVLTLAYGVGITIQATFEEVLVRGWMLQHIARVIPNILGALITTSVTFSVLHIGHAGWATYFATLIFGLAFGWSAIRLNGLEAAIGAHIGNNLLAALFAGQMISGNPTTMNLSEMAMFGIYVLGFLGLVEGFARLDAKLSLD